MCTAPSNEKRGCVIEWDRLCGGCTLVTETDRSEDRIRDSERARERRFNGKKPKDEKDRKMIREIRYERDEGMPAR